MSSGKKSKINSPTTTVALNVVISLDLLTITF